MHKTISFRITTTQSLSTCFDTCSTHVRHIIGVYSVLDWWFVRLSGRTGSVGSTMWYDLLKQRQARIGAIDETKRNTSKHLNLSKPISRVEFATSHGCGCRVTHYVRSAICASESVPNATQPKLICWPAHMHAHAARSSYYQVFRESSICSQCHCTV